MTRQLAECNPFPQCLSAPSDNVKEVAGRGAILWTIPLTGLLMPLSVTSTHYHRLSSPIVRNRI